MLEASKKISVSRSISVESMRNQKTFFDEFNAMQTVVETEYDSDGEVQGQNQLNQKNEIFGDNTLRNQQSHESLSQVEATYAEVIQEFQKFSELQHVCMDLAEEFVSPGLSQKPAESLQSQQEMKYKINGAFEVLSTQLQPMEYAEDVKEKFASFLEIQKSNPSFEAKQQVLSVVTRFIKNSSHSVFEESFPILAISLMETAKWDNSGKQKQNEEPEPDETTNAADETITAENITTVEINNSKQLQTTKTETVEVENEEIIPTQVRLRSSEMFLPNVDQTTTTNSENSNNRLAEPNNDNTERIEDGEPSCAFGSESRTDQLAESSSAAAEVSEHKESVEEIDHHEGKTERSETMNSETSGEESRLNERIPSTREGSIYINSLPTPTNNSSQPNYPSSLLNNEQKIVTKTTAEISTQTNDLVPDIVEPVERPGGKVKLGRRQTIWTSNASKSGYRPRSPRSSMRRGVAGGWRSGRAMSITSGGPEPTLETASPLPSHKQMLAHQSTIDLLGQSDSNKDERLKWYKEQKIEPSKMLKAEVNTTSGVNRGAVDVSKVMERMRDQNQQPLYTLDGRYLLIDPFDPERPRYTKTELMQVIEEKASLCIDKMNLQEELNNVRRELEDLRKATVTMTQRWFEDSNTMKRNQQHSKPSAIRRLFGIFSGRPNSFSRGRHHNRGPRGEFIPSRNSNEPRRLSHPTVLETDSNSAPLMIHELPLTLFNSDTHAPRGRTATENQSRNTTCEQNPAINSARENQSPTSRYSPFLYKRFSAKYAQKDKSVTLNYPSSKNNVSANQVNVDGPQSQELFSPATD
ncbi:uncharacterized protein LOC142351044 [Convolutriloba macropyga]|uniref:uncharacterized protein LOC142351044 n=1 Tax=Convolutriloba macropyga TaxID=536237 RepID=UPI003F51D9AE